MDLSTFQFAKLSASFSLTSFDCGNKEINEFLHDYSMDYADKRISSTYLFATDKSEIVAYFSISNNCVRDMGEVRGYNRKVWKRFHKQNSIPFEKQIKQYPAVLIGRLGVSTQYHGTGIAYQLIDFIKGWVLTDHKPACRFLILDAYNQQKQINYYEQNGFNFLLEEDRDKKTRLMYFDMKRLE